MSYCTLSFCTVIVPLVATNAVDTMNWSGRPDLNRRPLHPQYLEYTPQHIDSNKEPRNHNPNNYPLPMGAKPLFRVIRFLKILMMAQGTSGFLE